VVREGGRWERRRCEAMTETPEPGRRPERGFRAGWRQLGPAAPLALAVSTLPPIGGLILVAMVPAIAPELRANPVAGTILFVAASAVLIGLALLPTLSTSILAGWAFGFGWGFTAAMVAITIAALIAYGLARIAARDRVLGFIRDRPRWDAVYRALLGQTLARTAFVIFLLRLPPLAPMAMANFVFGALRVPLWTYLAATVLGMAPRTLASAFGAAQLQQLTFEGVEHPTLRIVGIVVSIASLVVLSVLARRGLRQTTGTPEPAEPRH
jgi:uncharacterized membrane protein YdjX (TVP38/TMEM64 family)